MRSGILFEFMGGDEAYVSTKQRMQRRVWCNYTKIRDTSFVTLRVGYLPPRFERSHSSAIEV